MCWKAGGRAFLKLSSNLDTWHLRNLWAICWINRLQSSWERLGSKLQVGKCLAYRLYLGPREADEITTENLQFKKEGVGATEKATLRRSQFTDRRKRWQHVRWNTNNQEMTWRVASSRRTMEIIIRKVKEKAVFQKGCDQVSKSGSIIRIEKSHCIHQLEDYQRYEYYQ